MILSYWENVNTHLCFKLLIGWQIILGQTSIFLPFAVILHTGLEKLGFPVNESSCSSKQVQGNIVRLIILRSLWRYEVKVLTSPFTSLCTKSDRLWKEKCWNKVRYRYIQCFFLWQYNYTWEHYHLLFEWL